MRKIMVKIYQDCDGSITVENGMEMRRAFVEAFNIPPYGEIGNSKQDPVISAQMKIYKKGKIVIEEI